ncbi:hypothetical protein ZOD2009_12352, partial [Haladaptatus paucihalophilus DX253]
PELEQGATTLAQVWINDVLLLLMRFTRFVRIEARGERAQTDVSYQFVPASPPSSNRSGDGLPYYVAFCVTHLSGLTGRANRGRTYFGPLSENDQNNNLINQSVANAFVGALNTIRSQMAAQGWEHVIVSRYLNKQRRAEGVATPVIGYRYYDLVLDTQRSRKRGQGS